VSGKKSCRGKNCTLLVAYWRLYGYVTLTIFHDSVAVDGTGFYAFGLIKS